MRTVTVLTVVVLILGRPGTLGFTKGAVVQHEESSTLRGVLMEFTKKCPFTLGMEYSRCCEILRDGTAPGEWSFFQSVDVDLKPSLSSLEMRPLWGTDTSEMTCNVRSSTIRIDDRPILGTVTLRFVNATLKEVHFHEGLPRTMGRHFGIRVVVKSFEDVSLGTHGAFQSKKP